MKSWSKTQSLIALSSAESELYGIVNATADALWLRSILQDLGNKFVNELFNDASAVLGVIQHQGSGRMKHTDCNFLYVQKLNAEKVFEFCKVPGADSPADLGTKALPWDAVRKHVAFSGGVPKVV